LTTQPVGAQQALSWGLVDACEENSEDLLRKHLLRLRRLSKPAISRYKRYVESLSESVRNSRPAALLANAEVFSDARNLANIDLYVRTGQFPWEDRQ
jgi:polyketide biosynthesis enoyl-CoA hydratase PksH